VIRGAVAKKRCIGCNMPKPLDAFYAHPSSRDRRQSRCKACDNRARAERMRRGTTDGPIDAVRLPDGSVVLRRRA